MAAGTLPLEVGTFPGFVLDIRLARIKMVLTGSGAQAKATQGIISGVLDTAELVSNLKKVAGAFDKSL